MLYLFHKKPNQCSASFALLLPAFRMEDAQILKTHDTKSGYVNFLVLPMALLAFLFAIHAMGEAFSVLGENTAVSIISITSNPFIGLFIGLLVTAILQSSSTTTSMVVAAVASGSLELSSAIPIVMGANIGTTLTSTIVSLSYITKTNEFRKAITAGTSHDIFNILAVLIIFPLEMKYQLLSGLSSSLGGFLKGPNNSKLNIFNGDLDLFSPLSMTLIEWVGPILSLLLSFILLLLIVKFISTLLYNKLIGNAKKNFNQLIFKNRFKSFGWGFLLTSIVQSSSLTTSLIVPLVATGKVSSQKAFQFILGANLGTTITALLAALFKSEAAISLAIAHFLFNFIGVAIFLLIPALQRLPTFIAEKLGLFMMRFRIIGFAYILVMFFALPFSLIYVSDGSPTAPHTGQAIKQ